MLLLIYCLLLLPLSVCGFYVGSLFCDVLSSFVIKLLSKRKQFASF